MKHWTRKWLPSLLAATLLISVTTNSLSITAYATAIDSVAPVQATVQPTYEQLRQAVIDSMNKATKEPNYDTILAAIDTFLLLPALDSYPVVGYQSDKDTFTEGILKTFDLLTGEDAAATREDLLLYFAVESMVNAESSHKPYDMGVADTLIKLLPESPERTELATRLNTLKTLVYDGVEDDYIDWLHPPDDLVIDPFDPPSPTATPTPRPSGSEQVTPKPSAPTSSPTPPPGYEIYDQTKLSYQVLHGVCYQVLDRYKDGVVVKTEKNVAAKSEKQFCGLVAAAPGSVDTTKGNNPFTNAAETTRHTIDYNPTKSTFNGYDPFDPSQREDVRNQDKGITTALEPISIQFTFDKVSESPYYHDTGIIIGETLSMNYDQAKDTLHQIAIQATGKFVEDTDQALALIDGHIIVVRDEQSNISISEFSSLFNGTYVDVRALDTRSGLTTELADLIEIKGISGLVVDGKAVPLTQELIVDNSIALFPLKEMVSALGGNVSVQGDQVTVTHENRSLVYTNGKSTLTVDGNEVDIVAPVRINKQGVMMAPIRALVDAFGKTMEVDRKGNIVIQ